MVEELLSCNHQGIFYGVVYVKFTELRLGLPGKLPQVFNNSLDSVVAFFDEFQPFPFRVIFTEVFEEYVQDRLRGHEWIIQFVGYAGNQLPEGPHFGCLNKANLGGFKLGLQTLLLCNIFEDSGSTSNPIIFTSNQEQ